MTKVVTFPYGLEPFMDGQEKNFLSSEQTMDIIKYKLKDLVKDDSVLNAVSKLALSVDLSQYSLSEYISSIHKLKMQGMKMPNNFFNYMQLCFPLPTSCSVDFSSNNTKPQPKESILKKIENLDKMFDQNYDVNKFTTDIANLPACITEPISSYIPLLSYTDTSSFVAMENLIKKNKQQAQKIDKAQKTEPVFIEYVDTFGYKPNALVKSIAANKDLKQLVKTVLAFSLILFRRVITTKCLFQDFNAFDILSPMGKSDQHKNNLSSLSYRNTLSILLPTYVVACVEYISKAIFLKQNFASSKIELKILGRVKKSIVDIINETNNWVRGPRLGDAYSENSADTIRSFVIDLIKDMTSSESFLKKTDIIQHTFIQAFYNAMWPIVDGGLEASGLASGTDENDKRLLIQSEVAYLGLLCFYLLTNEYASIMIQTQSIYKIIM